MHTVFRIREIQPTGENHRPFQVDLALTGNNDKDFRALTDHMREETFPGASGWHRLSRLLFKIGRFDKAQQLYEAMLGQTTSEKGRGSIYHEIVLTKDQQGEYEEAIIFYEKALDIYQKKFPSNHLDLSMLYNSIGTVYLRVGEYSKALSYYEKQLEIDRKCFPSNHPNLACSHNNIGNVYFVMGNYSKALQYYEKALEIRQQSFPRNYPKMAASYSNIGIVYQKMGQDSKALRFFERTVDIGQRALPPNHPSTQIYIQNLNQLKTKL
jgi:tetratricopeptide (TPR) repeat protein